MNATQMAIFAAVSAALLATLAGLGVRHRLPRCWLFAPYLLSALLPDVLITLWPDPFFTWRFWLLKESIQSALKFVLALELAARIFGAMPRARATVGAVVLVILASIALATWLAPAGDIPELAKAMLSRVLYGSMWLFTALLILVLWYRVPLDPLHRAILMGFAPYLLLSTGSLSWLASAGPRVREAASYVNTLAYLAVTIWWAVAAWRHEPAVAGDEAEALRVLQPWRG